MFAPTSDYQIEFLGRLQRLLRDGVFTSTYKYALLMAFMEIAVEHDEDSSGELVVPTLWVAEKFVRYYWRQAAPYLASPESQGAAVLIQNPGRQASVVELLRKVRDQFQGSLPAAMNDQKCWGEVVSEVNGIVRSMPMQFLQNLDEEGCAFLYDIPDRGQPIQLKPGVAYCLRKYQELISDLVRGKWALRVRRFNRKRLGVAADLQEFLFGSERTDLSVVVPILKPLQGGRCFYCPRELMAGAIHVDHFIPWSRYPVDLGHNLVLAHAGCNGKKSDWLASEEHLSAWVEHSEKNAARLDKAFDEAGVLHDFSATLRIVRWAYTQTFEGGDRTWVRDDERRVLQPGWDRPLARLLN